MQAAGPEIQEGVRKAGYGCFEGKALDALPEMVVYSSENELAQLPGFIPALCNEKEVMPADVFSVARGAAKRAWIFGGRNDRQTDHMCCGMDITPLSRGVETASGLMLVVAPRNITIPHKKTVTFTTCCDMQEVVVLNILEGERACARDLHLLAHIEMEITNRRPQGGVSIEVTFDMDANHILHIIATEVGGGGFQEVSITNDGSPTLAEIVQQITDAETYQAADDATRFAGATVLAQPELPGSSHSRSADP